MKINPSINYPIQGFGTQVEVNSMGQGLINCSWFLQLVHDRSVFQFKLTNFKLHNWRRRIKEISLVLTMVQRQLPRIQKLGLIKGIMQTVTSKKGENKKLRVNNIVECKHVNAKMSKAL